MTRYHLLYWVLKYLLEKKPGVVADMVEHYRDTRFNEQASMTVGEAIQERASAFAKAN